jgi:hypothetical protein
MTHLTYSHSDNRSLVETMFEGVRRVLVGRRQIPPVPAGRTSCRRRIFTVAGYLLALVIQAGLLWLLAELVQVVHGVMELWLQLATQHLDLISLYNAVRSK